MIFTLKETIIKKVLGQPQITIKELTIKEALEIQILPEEEMMFAMLSKAIVKPKVTIQELENMPSRYMNDIAKITDAINSTEPDGSK